MNLQEVLGYIFLILGIIFFGILTIAGIRILIEMFK